MRTYQELFRTPEFTPLLGTVSAQIAASTMTGLALGTLVYDETNSPLLSALAMFGPMLAQVAGATLLLSAADRLPPRGLLGGLGLVFAVGTAAMAVPGMPLWALFVIILGSGVLATLSGAVRFGLLGEIVPPEGFLLGRSVLNMASGVTQIAGFGVGGVMVAFLTPRGTLAAAAGVYAVAAVVARFGLTARAPRASGRASVRETWRVNRELWSSGPRRTVLLALWIPNGLVVGCESLYVPYAPDRAGLLFAAAAGGMLLGDVLVGRLLPPRWRAGAGTPLRVLLAVPYLLFALRPGVPVAIVLAVVASAGFAASLLLQEHLVALTPDEMSGQALGLGMAGLMAFQGLGAAVAGAVAQGTSAAAAMTIMAAASLVVTVILAPALARAAVPAADGRAAGPVRAAGTDPARMDEAAGLEEATG